MNSQNKRLEKDSVGELLVPEKAYYGVQSLRGSRNFRITERMLDPLFIKNLVRIKKAAASVNADIGAVPRDKANAIVEACDEILKGKLFKQFIEDQVQGGAGTSANMNVNEVIANRAIELLGGEKGDYSLIHPNDHVNFAQSTNDVIPTAGKMTAIELSIHLEQALTELVDAFKRKAEEFDDVIKMGRTQLQDAVPVRLGQEFAAYAAVLSRDVKRIAEAREGLRSINLGGSAIGTCINVPPAYLERITDELSRISGLELTPADDRIDSTQNLDMFVAMSGTLRTAAVNLSKIANDIRLLSSGPRAGLGEINLPAMQNGSSIMPGKVNPVIPEVVNQVAFLVIGHDTTVVLAAEAGQLELNAFEPVIFYQLFESISSLTHAVDTFTQNCVLGITVNREKCASDVKNSAGVVTAVTPYIGYARAAEIAKESLKTGVPVADIILREKLLDRRELERLLDPYSMTRPREIEKP